MENRVEICIGLISASTIATALTTVIVSIAISVESLIWQLGNQHSILLAPLEFIFGLLSVSALAVFFGFIGAALFLSVALLPLVEKGSQKSMVIAGGVAGFAHSIVGWGLRTADHLFGPLGDTLQSVVSWGGFFLTVSARQVPALSTFPASILAGCVAGLAFYKIAIRPPQENP